MKPQFEFLIILLFYSYGLPQQTLVNKIILGKYSYLIYKKNVYEHDNKWNAEYFVICKSGSHKRLCSAYLLAKRNDSTFISGNYIVYKDRIEFITHFYYNKNVGATDSVKNIFYPGKIGNLILKESVTFANGQKTIDRY